MPIFTAIGTAIAGALFAGSALAATLITSALAFGAKLAFSYLMRPKQKKYTAVSGEIEYGADVPVGVMFGRGKVKGHRIFYAKWGSGNKYNADVYVLSNGWCHGLEPIIYFYGQAWSLLPVAVVGGETARYTVAGYDESDITIRFYDGRPGQTTDALLVSQTTGLGQNWKATSNCAGLCYVIVTRKYGKKFAKGTPDFDFVLNGLRLYDPRKDSTVAGGSGAHRYNNPATWQFSENMALMRLNYQLGLRGQISGRVMLGEGKSLGQIDLSSYFVSMNVCDELRMGFPRYYGSMYVRSDDDHTEILKEFDDGMAGFALNRRGLSGVIPGAPQIPIFAIEPEHIPLERASELSKRKSAFEMYNHMSGQYIDPASAWGAESLKPVKVNLDVTNDGRIRQVANDFLQVHDANVAQYLLNIRYRQNRIGGQATIPVSRYCGMQVVEGDWVTYDGQTWMITEWRCDEEFRITLVLTETSADIYDDGAIDPGPIVIPKPPLVNPDFLSTVLNFRVEVGMINGATGYKQPCLRFSWDPPGDPAIQYVLIEYFIETAPEVKFTTRQDDPELGVHITSADVQSGVFYVARATIVTRPDRFTTWTPLETTEQSTDYTSIEQELESILNGPVKEILEGLKADQNYMKNLIERVATDSSVGTADNVRERQVYRAEINTNKAEIFDERRIRVDETSALAEATTLVTAKIDNPETGLGAQAAAIQSLAAEVHDDDTGLSALATAILGVEVNVGNLSAGGLISFKAQIPPPAGILAQINILARANTASAFINSGFVIQVYNSGGLKSRILAITDQFIIQSTAGTAQTLPFVVEGGVAKMALAHVKTIVSGMLRSADSRMQVDLTNGRIIIAD